MLLARTIFILGHRINPPPLTYPVMKSSGIYFQYFNNNPSMQWCSVNAVFVLLFNSPNENIYTNFRQRKMPGRRSYQGGEGIVDVWTGWKVVISRTTESKYKHQYHELTFVRQYTGDHLSVFVP